MTEKVRLGEGELKGGFTEEGKTQAYQINYLPPVIENGMVKFDAKLELAILTPGNEPDKVFYHSLRFVSPDQMKVVILKLVNAYAYFMFQKGQLNQNNSRTLPNVWRAEIENAMHKMIKDKQMRLS